MKRIVWLFALISVCLACSDDEDILDNAIVVEEEEEVEEDPVNFSLPCIDGFAGDYPCLNYGLIAQVPISTFNSDTGNDCWGWTDPDTGKEYALMGLRNGTGFVDISSPDLPVYLGKLPTATVPSGWRDIKVYGNHAFIVSEAPDHGMQVFDLTRLRNAETNSTFEADAVYTEFGNAHNIVINESTSFAYVVGSQTFNGGPHFIDISDPINPQPAGGYDMDDYSHDAQVVTYSGPDAEHLGKEIFIGSNTNEVVIVDITDKENPLQLSSISYPQLGYTHQGWFSNDQQYFLLGDELDEIEFGINSRTLVFDLADLDNPEIHTEYLGSTSAIDHNGYVRGNRFYQANYTAGMREIDLSGLSGGNLEETGFFDTYPEDNNPTFRGTWSVYPFFGSGNIILSNIGEGLFIIRRQ
ncbi:choice-of-anchor B family protein [Aureitalea marina]|uniref:Regulator n=1 Tax=Aureitalea marina TaxID=930804 RepID=A0A2S7KSN1_9FLAO|nr:choice-of-anchor B family protein [Aureitalea marina]PQB05635.1 regulator [Aureitalea marina]